MSKVIFLTEQRGAMTPAIWTGTLPAAGEPVRDLRQRPLRDLRISVTDRCNFRCTYCMPRDVFDSHYTFMPHSALLSFEEIARAARIFAELGTEKIRLTGGEPLMRKNLEVLIAMLADIRTPAGHPLDITLTTNGSLLTRKAQALKDAGLSRLTVSMDALDDATFQHMSDTDYTASDVLRGIDAAAQAGIENIKVNMVVRRNLNDDQILPMARQFRGTPHVLRFIEYMDVGSTNGWNLQDVIPSAEIVARLGAAYPLAPIVEDPMGRVAERWRYLDGEGEVGMISSVSQAFCGGCTRARLSPEGQLFLCLFAGHGHDLREVLRGNTDDDRLRRRIAQIWTARGDNYSEQRSAETGQGPRDAEQRVEMSYIGG